MNTRSLLDQLLSAGKGMLAKQNTTQPGAPGKSSPLDGILGGVGGGMLGGAAIGLLLGNKKARKMTGKVATYGGLAALGVVAYKAYNNWQQQQSGNASTQPELRTVDRVPPAEIEQHSEAILLSLIGAAKADGHIDDRERQLIDDAIAKLTGDTQLQHWFDEQLRKPLEPATIALAARTPEMAAEMYLASLIVVDQESYMERAYLDELARQMNIAPGLKAELESQARVALLQSS
ncbi:MAG: tellurite resistance TerB family protein [Pseudomonas sp.]